MTERCHEMAELADLAGLPAGDPRRRHLESCPRCRGLAEAQGLFLDPGDTSDLPDLDAADAALTARLAPALAAPPGVRPRRRRTGWYALAAALAVCALGLGTAEVLRMRGGSGPRVGAHVRGDAAAGLTVTLAAGVLDGAWAAAPAGDAFVLVLLDRNLAEVGRVPATGPVFTATGLPTAAVFCQAFAVSHGDTVGRSGIVALRPAGE